MDIGFVNANSVAELYWIGIQLLLIDTQYQDGNMGDMSWKIHDSHVDPAIGEMVVSIKRNESNNI